MGASVATVAVRAARVGAAGAAAAEATAVSAGAGAGLAAGGAAAAGGRVVVARPQVVGVPAAAAAAVEESARARARGEARVDATSRRSTRRNTRLLSATGPRSPGSQVSCSRGRRRRTSSCSQPSRRLRRRPCALGRAAWSMREGDGPLQQATCRSAQEPSGRRRRERAGQRCRRHQ